METVNIKEYCIQQAELLLDKHFGNLAEQPESIGHYDLDLPLRIENEYREILRHLWNNVAHDNTRNFDSLFDKEQLRDQVTADDRENIVDAYKKANRRNLWERITKTNHRDVIFYKGLLEEYARELLSCMRQDFLEEFDVTSVQLPNQN